MCESPIAVTVLVLHRLRGGTSIIHVCFEQFLSMCDADAFGGPQIFGGRIIRSVLTICVIFPLRVVTTIEKLLIITLIV